MTALRVLDRPEVQADTSDFQVFTNPVFGNIRTITEDGKTLFCGSDVAKALGYKRPADAITAHCKGSVIRRLLTNGGEQAIKFIPEGDIYRLAAKSELPGADQFESWIFDDVLPTIHRHGAYMTPDTIERVLTDPDTIINLATQLKAERERTKALEAQAEENAPKVLFADSVSASKDSILVGELAKLLKQNGVDIGQNRLFRWLRANGYLIKRGESYNLPTQRSMEQGLFEIKEVVYQHPDGNPRTKRTAKVTGKGQQAFIELFLRRKAENGGEAV